MGAFGLQLAANRARKAASPYPPRRCRPRYRAASRYRSSRAALSRPNWLHEIKHDGHRLPAIIAGGELQLISRNGHDRTQLFRAPFDKLGTAGLPAMVLDGEIAVPDERGVTHIDALTEALRQQRLEPLAYFAFDLLRLDGHDLRPCPIEDRKALLRDVIGAGGGGDRVVFVGHVVGFGQQLFEAVRQVGAEGVVSKRAGSAIAAAPTATGFRAGG